MKLRYAMALIAAAALHAQDITGDWQGSLKVSGVELHLVLHVAKDLTATLDSLDQGAKGIPMGPVTVAASKFSFASSAMSAKYEGKLNANASSIDGTWTQGPQSLPLVLTRPSKLAPPSDIDGAWLGTLDVGGTKLRLVFHFVNTQDGLTATWDSPDQGANGVPVTTVTRTGPSLKLEMKQIGASFEGKLAPDQKKLEGTFTQRGMDMPLVLTPMKDSASLERKRPQNPVKPYPYREEEVTYRNESAGIELAATLTLPPGKGPFPAVLLITGSGPQDRDESLLGHKPFLVLSDHLTRKGIAVLRADDRGTAKSGGKFETATSADFATDAEAGLAYLKTRSEIDPRKLGLVGHSEGGMIAPMIAARNPSVAFIVMMAGTGVSGADVLVAQVSAVNESSGATHEKAQEAGAKEREVLGLILKGAGSPEIESKIREASGGKVSEEQLKAQMKQLQSPWFQFFLKYDPAVDLRKVKCPVLAINGEKDKQVLPEQNLPAIRKALEASGNKQFEVEQLPGLNHLFQTAKTGGPGEYAEIEETISPLALNKISGWILRR